jgi:uncharacterized protein YggE
MIVVLMGAVQPAWGQLTPPAPPVIVAHGRGEAEAAPDRVELIIRVETRAPTAARAAQDNARATQAVLDTLRRGVSLTDGNLGTTGFELRPDMSSPGDGRPSRVVGYIAVNSVRVRTERLPLVGAIIDAAIARGANGVYGPAYYVDNPAEARRSAMVEAVRNARRDAEAMAAAAGGRLGALVEMTADPPEYDGPRRELGRVVQFAAASTPIEVPELRESARVTAKWRFIAQ